MTDGWARHAAAVAREPCRGVVRGPVCQGAERGPALLLEATAEAFVTTAMDFICR